MVLGKCSYFMCGFFDLAKAKHTLSLWVLKSKQYCEKKQSPTTAGLPSCIGEWAGKGAWDEAEVEEGDSEGRKDDTTLP